MITPEQDMWLRGAYMRLSVPELHQEMVSRFGFTGTLSQIKGYLFRNKIFSGRTGRFTSGNQPWNADKKGYMSANVTSFKKGSVPPNIKPMFSERLCKDGSVLMKVPEENPYTGSRCRYKHKQVWLWEQAHGKTPAGWVVIFADGDRHNFALENLVAVSRRHLLALNQHGYHAAPAELKPSIFALARLEAEAGFVTSKKRPEKTGIKTVRSACNE